jgi:hypothetical protein
MSGGALDTARRKRAKRSGREAGCWTYIDGEALRRAGFADGELPFYRVVGYQRSRNAGSAIVSLFRQP